jgi:hypothetical protein
MVADTVSELLGMADRIGVSRKWFQWTSHPHFDISLSKRALAVQNGAVEVGRRGLVAAMKRHRERMTKYPAELAAVRAAFELTNKT